MGGPGAVGNLFSLEKTLGDSFGVLEPFQTKIRLNETLNELKSTIISKSQPPVVLAGQSWGDWLSIMLASRFPKLVGKLIFINSTPFEESYAQLISSRRMEKLTPEERREYSRLLLVFNIAAGESDDDRLFRRLGELALKSDSYSLVKDKDGEPEIDIPQSQNIIYENMWPKAAKLRRTWKLIEYLKKIKCPITVIHGFDDSHPVSGVIEPLKKNIINFVCHILERCGHEPRLEKYAQKKFYEILNNEIPL